VLEACPDIEWRAIVALSRYGGLRCPSEQVLLSWQDIDWESGRVRITSPKTAQYPDGAVREIPLFPELHVILAEAFEQAKPGAVYVIQRYRSADQNLRTQFLRILKRAGVTPWPRLFHNLRATRETELAHFHPLHVVCKWIGNSPAVARRHYLQVTDFDFQKATQNPTHHLDAPSRTEPHGKQVTTISSANPKNPKKKIPPTGIEQTQCNPEKT
jgi:integrase